MESSSWGPKLRGKVALLYPGTWLPPSQRHPELSSRIAPSALIERPGVPGSKHSYCSQGPFPGEVT